MYLIAEDLLSHVHWNWIFCIDVEFWKFGSFLQAISSFIPTFWVEAVQTLETLHLISIKSHLQQNKTKKIHSH